MRVGVAGEQPERDEHPFEGEPERRHEPERGEPVERGAVQSEADREREPDSDRGGEGWTSTTLPPIRRLSSAGLPVATARPWSMITTWLARWSASSRYCVVKSTSVPVSTRPNRVP